VGYFGYRIFDFGKTTIKNPITEMINHKKQVTRAMTFLSKARKGFVDFILMI
jgi:hypothetical protein